ncbi:hypothetical protein GCM10009836_59450 [Pseudonocardia ailaonensis]|uniref:Uncharacterized protein n=1 Tax=Pseudonocardia ailaonensis TaxID=367279 RepID=A0ABN2NLR3_9PSEU
MTTGWIVVLGLAALLTLGVAIGRLQAHAHRQAWRSIIGETPPVEPRARTGERPCATCRVLTGALDDHVHREH